MPPWSAPSRMQSGFSLNAGSPFRGHGRRAPWAAPGGMAWPPLREGEAEDRDRAIAQEMARAAWICDLCHTPHRNQWCERCRSCGKGRVFDKKIKDIAPSKRVPIEQRTKPKSKGKRNIISGQEAFMEPKAPQLPRALRAYIDGKAEEDMDEDDVDSIKSGEIQSSSSKAMEEFKKLKSLHEQAVA
eukprot:14218295-Alexandrium_andersonii.AAC.1